MDDRLSELGLLEIAAELAAGRLSAVELTHHQLDRIAARDPGLRAFATRTPERALAEAARADAELLAGRYRGPLHGVPVAVKDLVEVAGVPTAAGMPLHAGRIAAADAAVLRNLTAAGAVLLGTVQMTEGAYFEHHPGVPAPRNPWDPELWPGASSSGPAVAVAAGLAFATVGSDTGGSIRFPAAANRVVGLKPTQGLISRRGTIAAAESLDHLGPFARSTADAGAMLRAMLGDTPARHCEVGEPVIGVDDSMWRGVDEVTAAALRGTRDALAGLGAVVREVTVPDTAAVRDAWAVICSAEAATGHRDTYPRLAHRYGALAGFLDAGLAVSAADLAAARRVRSAFGTALAPVFGEADLLLLPTQPAANITNAEKDALIADPVALADFIRFATPFDMTGHPTLTLPVRAGTQVASVQLVARHHAEELLVRIGHALESTAVGTPPLAGRRAADPIG